MKEFFIWIGANWERVLFSGIGLFCFFISGNFLLADKITDASIVFGLGFLAFIFANVARFKRFKGLGFEAELWEDKQNEAAALIDRLRSVVSIYTREVVMAKVVSGKIFLDIKWEEKWKLFDDLINQHEKLGQKIDFSDLKKEIDDYFLFDIFFPKLKKINEAIKNSKSEVSQKFLVPHGTFTDKPEYQQVSKKLSQINFHYNDAFEFSKNNNPAARTLKEYEQIRLALLADFNVDVVVDNQTIIRLQEISNLYESRPVVVTTQLVRWANGED